MIGPKSGMVSNDLVRGPLFCEGFFLGVLVSRQKPDADLIARESYRGEESKCGWLKDKFGLSWQVVPTALGRYLSDPDRKKADRAMQAMMKMQKIVIAELDKAYAG